MDAVILAAGMGKRLNHHTRNCPKCLLKVGGMSIIERQITHLRRKNVEKIHIVIGHEADKVKKALSEAKDIHYIFNPEFSTTNVIMSLMMALPYIKNSFYCFCGDCVFEGDVIDKLVPEGRPIVLATARKQIYETEAMKVSLLNDRVIRMGKQIPHDQTHAEFIGLAAVHGSGVELLKQQVVLNISAGQKNIFFGDVVDELIRDLGVEVKSVDVTGEQWCEIDYEDDLQRARTLFANR